MVGYGAGSSCGTWPLCRGSLFPEGTAYAIHMGHRYLAAVVGVVVLAAVWRAWNRAGAHPSVRMAAAALAAVFLAQTLAGGRADLGGIYRRDAGLASQHGDPRMGSPRGHGRIDILTARAEPPRAWAGRLHDSLDDDGSFASGDYGLRCPDQAAHHLAPRIYGPRRDVPGVWRSARPLSGDDGRCVEGPSPRAARTPSITTWTATSTISCRARPTAQSSVAASHPAGPCGSGLG